MFTSRSFTVGVYVLKTWVSYRFSFCVVGFDAKKSNTQTLSKEKQKKKMKSFVSVSRVVSFSLYISIRIGIRIFLFQLLFIRTKIGQRARKNVFIKNLPNQFKIFRPQIYHTGLCVYIYIRSYSALLLTILYHAHKKSDTKSFRRLCRIYKRK